jgi:DNA-binding XRE family transcriptional regulator
MKVTLKAARINKGLTQEDVAKALNVTKKTVGSWEMGKTMPKIDKIENLCSLLGCRYDDIIWNV